MEETIEVRPEYISDGNYFGPTFNGTFFNSLKFYREGGIPDNYGIIGTQMIGSGGLGIGSLGTISDCIEGGVVFRIDENTIYFLLTSEVRYEGINIFFCLVNENGEPVDTTLTAQTNKTIVTTNTYITNSDSFQFHSDENNGLIVDRCDILVDSPSNWEIQTNIALTGSEILAITNGEMAITALASEIVQMGVGFIDGTKLIINKSLFSMLKTQGLTTIGCYLLSSDGILIEANNIITNCEPVIDFNTLYTPYFFETNGQHKVEFEVFKNMFLTDFQTSQFAFNGSCATYFSEDAFCEMNSPNGSFLEDCKYLKEFTIPRNFYLPYYKLPNDGALEKVNLKGEHINADGISKVINGTYILTGYRNTLILCLDKSSNIQIPPEIKNINLSAFNHLKTMEYLNIPIKSNIGSSLSNNYVKVINYNNNYLPKYIYSTSLTRFNNYADDIKVNNPAAFNSCPNVKFYGNATSDGNCLLSRDGVTKYLLHENELTAYTFTNDVKGIGKNTLRQNTIKHITLPSGVTIMDEAFSGKTNLTAVTLNGPINSGINSFRNCTGMTTLYVDSLDTYMKSKYANGYSSPAGSTGDYTFTLFVNGSVLHDIVIPSSINIVNNHLFYKIDTIRTVKIPSHVTEIQKSAFYHCLNLSSVTIENGLKIIGSYAFAETIIHEIIIPDSVTEIGDHAFSYSATLRSIVLPKYLDKISKYAFQHCMISHIDIPETVSEIEEGAFNGCKNLQNIEIPEKVTNIEDYTFYECSSLNSINIPNSVTSIGYAAFYGCKLLQELIIPSSVRKIGDYAFKNCLGLKTVTVNEGISEIGQYAFHNCQSLIKVELPSTLTKIGTYFIVAALSLTEITCYATTAPVLDGLTFGTIATHGKLKVPAGSDYSSWMKNEDGYLGRYNWTIEYI